MKKTNEKKTEADNIDTQTEENPERRVLLTDNNIALLQWALNLMHTPTEFDADVIVTLYLKKMSGGYVKPFKVSSESVLFKTHKLEETEETENSNQEFIFKTTKETEKPNYFG